MNTRTALVRNDRDEPQELLRRVRTYMPGNYKANLAADGIKQVVVITGQDNAGWTLDGYVIPRLASGLIFAEEISNNTLEIIPDYQQRIDDLIERLDEEDDMDARAELLDLLIEEGESSDEATAYLRSQGYGWAGRPS